MNDIEALVAYDDNRCMGLSTGGLPWHIPEDLQDFKAKTIDNIVIMGRKTWESLPNAPLSHRLNLVVSGSLINSLNSVSWSQKQVVTSKHPRYDNVEVCASLRIAATYAGKIAQHRKIFIIGGAQIFKSALDDGLIETFYVTRVKGIHEGDIFFPALPTNVRWSVNKTFENFQYEKLIIRRQH